MGKADVRSPAKAAARPMPVKPNPIVRPKAAPQPMPMKPKMPMKPRR